MMERMMDVTEGKKLWEKPELTMLEIKHTNDDGGFWHFKRNGDFWVREFINGVPES